MIRRRKGGIGRGEKGSRISHLFRAYMSYSFTTLRISPHQFSPLLIRLYIVQPTHALYHQRRRQQQQHHQRQQQKHQENRKAAAATASTDEATTHRKLSAPNPPTNLLAVPSWNFQLLKLPAIDLSWVAPAGGSPPTAYKVYVDGKLLETTTLLETSILHLTIGQRYLFGVSAVNPDGESSRVETSQTAQIGATAPRNVQAVPGDRTMDLYWDPPANDGGTPITGYDVFINPSAGDCVPTSATSCRFSDLINGEDYQMSVMATKPQPSNVLPDVSWVRGRLGKDEKKS